MTIKILVVEDEALLRMDIADTLQDLGFVVFEAVNADEAIALLETHPEIQVMFTDVDMPGTMDGLRLAAAVRNRWPPVRIIVTSGQRHVQLTDIPQDSRFLGKPYSAEAVVGAIHEMIP